MTEESKTVVGSFEVERLDVATWRVTNLHFGYKYVTYGVWEDVHDQLLEQTEAWERRMTKKKHGDGWRGKMKMEYRKDTAAKEEKASGT